MLVSGVHKKLNSSLWKADSFNQEFADHQGDLLNCKDGVVSNSGIKEFWDGFEDLTSEWLALARPVNQRLFVHSPLIPPTIRLFP